jgi:branched-chain amino acid transport system permease protein
MTLRSVSARVAPVLTLVLMGTGCVVFALAGWSHLVAQWTIAMLACLSVTLLLGQGGLLSFGQALYFGAGAYAVVLIRPLLPDTGLGVAVGMVLLPMLGGMVAAALACAMGPWLLRHGGVAFAMMTLALGELVFTFAQSLPQWLGGEAGLAFNRAVALVPTGFNLGQEPVVVALMVVYAALGIALALRWVNSPLGLGWRASRDNPHRVQSLGYSLPALRLRLLMASSGLCGVAGGLFALYFEHVSTDVFGAQRSSLMLLFALLGGLGSLWGALWGSLLWVLAQQVLSQWTPGWMVYLGLAFMLLVVVGPQRVSGAASLPHPPGAKSAAKRSQLWLAWACTGLGLVALVEMGYQWRDISTLGAYWRVAGWAIDITHAWPWALAVGVFLLGGVQWWRNKRSRV